MKKILSLVVLFSATSVLAASPECTKEPKEKWQNEKAFQDNLIKEGYKINKFKVTKGNCYEIYGWDKDKKKVEIYFSPVDGKKVKEEIH